MAITQESQPLSSPSLQWSELIGLLKERNDHTQFLPQLRKGFRNLDEENQKDPQHPKKYPDILFQILVYAKSYRGITWRDTWETAKTLCIPDGFPVLSYVTIYLRSQEIYLQSLLGSVVDTESDPIDLPEEDAIDDTGLKEKGPGEWDSKIHHPKKHRQWLKFHALINTYNWKIRTYGLSSSSIKGKHCAKTLIHRAQRYRPIKKYLAMANMIIHPCMKMQNNINSRSFTDHVRIVILNQMIIPHAQFIFGKSKKLAGRNTRK
jgi:hypothetical protein